MYCHTCFSVNNYGTRPWSITTSSKHIQLYLIILTGSKTRYHVTACIPWFDNDCAVIRRFIFLVLQFVPFNVSVRYLVKINNHMYTVGAKSMSQSKHSIRSTRSASSTMFVLLFVTFHTYWNTKTILFLMFFIYKPGYSYLHSSTNRKLFHAFVYI